MGLFNQLSRSVKQMFRNLFRKKKRRKRRSQRSEEPVEVPETWMKEEQEIKPEKARKAVVVTKHKTRIPGLRLFHRILYAVMLLLNLVFSQFLLGSVGTGAQPMFLFFVLNAYCLFRLLWGSRKKEKST